MIDDCGFATGFVVTVKVAAVDPAGTVTLGGTVAAVGLLLDSATATPPPGAEEVNETVAVTGCHRPRWPGEGKCRQRRGRRRGRGADRAPGQGGGGRGGRAVIDRNSAGGRRREPGPLHPEPAGAPRWCPWPPRSTVIIRLAAAVPSTRRVPPLTSAREMVTAPYPDSGSQRHQHQGGSQNARHLQAPEPPGQRSCTGPPGSHDVTHYVLPPAGRGLGVARPNTTSPAVAAGLVGSYGQASWPRTAPLGKGVLWTLT